MKAEFSKDKVTFTMTHGEAMDICKTLIAFKELTRKQNHSTPCWNFILNIREWIHGQMEIINSKVKNEQ